MMPDDPKTARLPLLKSRTRQSDWRRANMAKYTAHLAVQRALVSGIRAEIRQMRAQQMLKETDLSVAEIAARLGYGEPSAFYRAFSKLAGTTPASFRARK